MKRATRAHGSYVRRFHRKRPTCCIVEASLKDLGGKWFAFSKMEQDALKIIEQLNG